MERTEQYGTGATYRKLLSKVRCSRQICSAGDTESRYLAGQRHRLSSVTFTATLPASSRLLTTMAGPGAAVEGEADRSALSGEVAPPLLLVGCHHEDGDGVTRPLVGHGEFDGLAGTPSGVGAPTVIDLPSALLMTGTPNAGRTALLSVAENLLIGGHGISLIVVSDASAERTQR